MSKVAKGKSFCYNRTTGRVIAGDGMNGKIRILDIEIDDRTAKEAMKETVRYIDVYKRQDLNIRNPLPGRETQEKNLRTPGAGLRIRDLRFS